MTNPFQITDDDIREAINSMPVGSEGRVRWEEYLSQREKGRERLKVMEAERAYHEVLSLVGSEERAAKLCSWADDLSHDEVRSLLTDFWDLTEAWSGDPALCKGMMGLLRRVAPLIVPDGGQPLPMKKLLVVYRGNQGEVPGTGSWTLDWMTAKRFARMGQSLRGVFLGIAQEDGIPTLWRGVVARRDVLGYFDGRGEREVVIDAGSLIGEPRKLRFERSKG